VRSALAEKPYCITVPGNAYQPETQQALARRIVDLLKNPEELDRLRPKFQELAHQESWENVARQWFSQP
jgi:glycosyltransferase involved in cell wall biosynthesis